PPVTSTRPSGNNAAAAPSRAEVIAPAATQEPLDIEEALDPFITSVADARTRTKVAADTRLMFRTFIRSPIDRSTLPFQLPIKVSLQHRMVGTDRQQTIGEALSTALLRTTRVLVSGAIVCSGRLKADGRPRVTMCRGRTRVHSSGKGE